MPAKMKYRKNREKTSGCAISIFKFCRIKRYLHKNNFQIKDVVLANEHALYSENDTRKYIRKIVEIMQQNIDHGINTPGILPGSIKLQRRAPGMYKRLQERFENNVDDALYILDWVNLWAFAVAEENAAGGKIITAPTMGSAGIVPAVMRYYQRFAHKKLL